MTNFWHSGKVVVFSLILIGLCTSNLGQAAQVTYTTSTGAIFSQVYQPGFSLSGSGLAWKDPSGLIWSDILWPSDSGTKQFSNQPIEPDHGNAIIKSPATIGCQTIGGLLPSAMNYKELLSNFERNAYGKLTVKGRHDLETLFKDMAGRPFWTSTTIPSRPDIAWWFDSIEGRVIYTGKYPNRHETAFVRCVAP